jgi:hypothetical protein
MMRTLPPATALPENTGDGYVAAAYIVFFLILLIYVAIMALRLSHVQRDLRDLQARGGDAPRPGEVTAPEARKEQSPGTTATGAATTGEPREQALEREPA